MRKKLILVLSAGLFAVILQNAFTYPALRLTDSSIAAILKQSAVLLYVGFSFLFIKEDKPNVKKMFGAFLGFCGILIMNYTGSGFVFNFGNLLMICASFCIVISSVIYKKTFKYVNPISATAVSQLFGGIVLALVGFFMGGKITVASISLLWILLYIGLASSVSYALWYTIVNKAELSKLFIIKFAEPVFSCLFAAVVLREKVLTLQHLLACILIFIGIYVSNKKQKS